MSEARMGRGTKGPQMTPLHLTSKPIVPPTARQEGPRARAWRTGSSAAVADFVGPGIARLLESEAANVLNSRVVKTHVEGASAMSVRRWMAAGAVVCLLTVVAVAADDG